MDPRLDGAASGGFDGRPHGLSSDRTGPHARHDERMKGARRTLDDGTTEPGDTAGARARPVKRRYTDEATGARRRREGLRAKVQGEQATGEHEIQGMRGGSPHIRVAAAPAYPCGRVF